MSAPCHPDGRSRRRAALAAVCLVWLGAAGCTYPKVVTTFEFLRDYDRMTNEHEPNVSLVYFRLPGVLRSYRRIVIGEIDVAGVLIRDPERAARYAELMAPRLQKELVKLGAFRSVCVAPLSDAEDASQVPTARLDTCITVFSFGSGWRRYWSYWLWFLAEWGASDIQIEGRVVDADTGRILMEFADRRRLTLNTPFGPHARASDDQFVMAHTIKHSLIGLALVLSGYRSVPEAEEALLVSNTRPSP